MYLFTPYLVEIVTVPRDLCLASGIHGYATSPSWAARTLFVDS